MLPELPEAAGPGPVEARLALRTSMAHENSIKNEMKKEWTRDQEQKVASLILDSMRYSAISRFERMQRDFSQLDDHGAVISGAFNGISMAKSLVTELENGVVDEEDANEHQRLVDVMITTKLQSNCLHTDYVDKVTELRVKHNPYLDRPYIRAGLSRIYHLFLPEDLQVDARAIRRSLEDKGDWSNPDLVLGAFQKLVKQLHDPD